jgi:hypothetical protein
LLTIKSAIKKRDKECTIDKLDAQYSPIILG